jgi:hypothetical protein
MKRVGSGRPKFRRALRSVIDARRAEQHLIRARHELAALEQTIADLTIEYAQLQEQLREASTMLQLRQEQIAAIQHEIDGAAKRSKWARWLSLLSFIIGVVISYVVEWTAGPLKPPWLP